MEAASVALLRILALATQPGELPDGMAERVMINPLISATVNA